MKTFNSVCGKFKTNNYKHDKIKNFSKVIKYTIGNEIRENFTRNIYSSICPVCKNEVKKIVDIKVVLSK